MSRSKNLQDFQELRRAKTRFLESLRDEKRLLNSTLEIYEREIDQLIHCLETSSTSELKKTLAAYSPATHLRKLVIWKSFLRQCPTPWQAVLEDFKSPRVRSQEPRFLDDQEAFQMESATFRSRTPTRDRLFLLLGLELGLRLQEILALRFQDIEKDWIKVQRKGGHEQRLPLTPSLQALIRFHQEEQAADASHFVFEGRSGKPMSSRAGQKLIQRLAKSARLNKDLSPHALRHTFATKLAAHGANLVALKELLGHKQMRTTERYLHITPAYLKDALQFLKPRGRNT